MVDRLTASVTDGFLPSSIYEEIKPRPLGNKTHKCLQMFFSVVKCEIKCRLTFRKFCKDSTIVPPSCNNENRIYF